MPSKELTNDVATFLRNISVSSENGGSFSEYECKEKAEELLSTILAALQELNANQEQIGFREAFDSFQMLDGEPFLQTDVAQRVFSAVLAASALGEQSK